MERRLHGRASCCAVRRPQEHGVVNPGVSERNFASLGLPLIDIVDVVAARLNERPEGIVVCRENGELLFINDRVARMLQTGDAYRPPSEWITHYRLGPPEGEYRDVREVPLLAALEFGTVESRLMRSMNGSRTELLRAWARAVTAEHGHLCGSVAVLYPEKSSPVHAWPVSPIGVRTAVKNSGNIQATAAILNAAEVFADLIAQSRIRSTPVRQVHSLIRERYSEPWTLESIAVAVATSPAYLTSLYGRQTGVTIMADLTRVRMAHARELIENAPVTIGEAAYRVGFRDLAHFSRIFRRTYGISPSQLRTAKNR